MRISLLQQSAIVVAMMLTSVTACGGKILEAGDGGGPGGAQPGNGSGGAASSDGSDASAPDGTLDAARGAEDPDACVDPDDSPFDAGASCYSGPGGPGGAQECGCDATISGDYYDLNCDATDTPVCTCTSGSTGTKTFTLPQPVCRLVCGVELPTLADLFSAPAGCGFPSP